MDTTGGSGSGRLVPTLICTSLVVAVIGSLGAPLITSVAAERHVSLAAAQWTLTAPLLLGAVSTPLLGRFGVGARRRHVVLATLGVVVVGSVLTVLPLPFAGLLVGRALQGLGLALPPLMIAVARDHLPAERASEAIAVIAVASTVGIGVGYPVAGLLTETFDVRAAYLAGLVIAALALALATWALPPSPARPTARVDVLGAVLLTSGLLAALLVLSQTELWFDHLTTALAAVVGAGALLALWVVRELHTPEPLVDLRLLRSPLVARANALMGLGGVGMYLLLTLVSRFAQTGSSAGYGLGLGVLAAGCTLVAFSVCGFAAGRLERPLAARMGHAAVLALSTSTVIGGFVVFVLARSSVIGIVASLALLGLGVGGYSSAMPGLILGAVPADETASAMAFNQVVRSVGFSVGSAVGGLVLAGATASGAVFPRQRGYLDASLLGIFIMGMTLLLTAMPRRRQSPSAA